MSPRAASAQLVAAALDFIGDGAARVVDVGTGTGALAIAIASAAPRALLWAIDTSPDAVAVTRANVLRHGLADHIIVCHADLLDPVPSPIDLVVANLPYLRAADAAQFPDLASEPSDAVFAEGHPDPARISPDNWSMDLHFLERLGARRVQLDLLYDYRTNVGLYPQWQAFLRERRPNADSLGGERHLLHAGGGRAHLRDLPEAELHMLDSGHFAVEDSLEQITAHIKRFYAYKVDGSQAMTALDRTGSAR